MRFNTADALFFDFDGTLVDSAPDLALAVNNMLLSMNKATFTEEKIRGWVGNGPELLIARALSDSVWPDPNLDKALLESALKLYFQFYENDICVKTRLYEGVKDTIHALEGKIPMVIITNKTERFVGPILENLGLAGYFDFILGGDTLAEKKPSPLPLIHAAKALSLQVENCVMVGDSKNDIMAAKSANAQSIGLTYGYNYGVPIQDYEPNCTLDNFSEILDVLPISV